MKLIVITPDHPVDNEADAIMSMLDSGVSRVHLRHPSLSADDTRRLINQIDRRYYSAISLHDRHDIAAITGCGIHLNGRNLHCPKGYVGTVSRSCHSIEEAAASTDVDYCFLSPVFDSISKHGYTSAFTTDELREAFASRRLGGNVVALGGISAPRIELLGNIGFKAVATIGAAWGDGTPGTISTNIKKLLKCCNS